MIKCILNIGSVVMLIKYKNIKIHRKILLIKYLFINPIIIGWYAYGNILYYSKYNQCDNNYS